MTGEPVLLVDDNPGNMKLVSFLLESEGYEVKTATSAVAALGVLRDFRPRLILMDLQMPGMDGYELTRRLKATDELRGVLIVAVTAYAMVGDKQKALDAGCDGYITKPIDTRSFPQLIARLLRSAGEPAPPSQ